MFRLDTQISDRSYDESIYLSLITLDAQEEIIEFEHFEDNFFVVTSSNKVYFLKDLNTGKLMKESEASLPKELESAVLGRNFFILVIDSVPFLLFPHMAVSCQGSHCELI